MRAVVESPRMTELNGIAADRVSAAAWALSSFFAGLAGVLIAPRFSTLAAGEFFNIVVVAIAAAAVGYLVSLPRAFLGGLGLGILIALFNTFIPKWSDDFTWLAPIQNNLTPAIPFIVLFGILVFSPEGPSDATRERPARRRRPSAHLADARRSRTPSASPSAACSAPRSSSPARVVLFTRGDTVWIFLVTQAVALAIVFLSITVMTGFGGHISLAQGAFAAIGGFTVFQLVDRFDMPVLVGALIGARHRGGGRRAAVAAAAAAERHLDRHRHAGVRLLLQLGDGQVLLGRRVGERRGGDAARAPPGARAAGTSTTTRRSSRSPSSCSSS